MAPCSPRQDSITSVFLFSWLHLCSHIFLAECSSLLALCCVWLFLCVSAQFFMTLKIYLEGSRAFHRHHLRKLWLWSTWAEAGLHIQLSCTDPGIICRGFEETNLVQPRVQKDWLVIIGDLYKLPFITEANPENILWEREITGLLWESKGEEMSSTGRTSRQSS